jgi:hypothetical protein
MFYANNSSKIVFDLSCDEKYDESVPLITAALLSSDGTMGIEINNVENCLKNLSETTIIKLIETGNSLPNNLEQQITLINGKLPDTCRLYLSKDGKSLLLRLKPNKGFKVIIR